jgi:hypothetical protein
MTSCAAPSMQLLHIHSGHMSAAHKGAGVQCKFLVLLLLCQGAPCRLQHSVMHAIVLQADRAPNCVPATALYLLYGCKLCW